MNGKWFIRMMVVVGIAVVAWGAALLLGRVSGKGDDFFYDSFYRLRGEKDMRGAEVVMVAVDQASLTAAGKGWPWPRSYWGEICGYLDRAGAKVIAFDIVFPEPSAYGDDGAFAEAVNKVKVPVVFGSVAKEDGDWETFAVKGVEKPVFGAVNLGNDKVYRRYPAELNGQSSLAEATVMKAGGDLSMVMGAPDVPFLLHYYGPHARKDGEQTFRFVPAFNVLKAARGEAGEGVVPEIFKGKIVVVCAIALGTFDLKASPLSDEYPGPEVQATAMVNLLRSQQVHVVPGWNVWLMGMLAALGVAAGVVYPRRAWVKVGVPVVVLGVVLGVCIGMFRGEVIWWLSPVMPLVAILAATPLAFGYTYFSEDRQRRFMLKALSKVVSPAVAEELARNPGRLALGTVRREITILFTDVAGFTDLAEGMDVQDLGRFINRYLGEMSARVFEQDGTLDKYIGDAVMAFWNAPVGQEDHAVRACRAALAMVRREREMQGEFGEIIAGGGKKGERAGDAGGAGGAGGHGRDADATRVFTRIGIHTSAAAVGFIGSEHLFNYTAMGDGVNLASRMEGANKIYGTQILVTESTAALVKEKFWLRRVDVLRVKGKKVPMAVYEVMGEKGDEHRRDADATAGKIELYEGALEAYVGRRWEESEKLLLELCTRFGQDACAEVLRARVSEFRKNPPPADWDGVHVSKTK